LEKEEEKPNLGNRRKYLHLHTHAHAQLPSVAGNWNLLFVLLFFFFLSCFYQSIKSEGTRARISPLAAAAATKESFIFETSRIAAAAAAVGDWSNLS
jgi:hypothetical protein